MRNCKSGAKCFSNLKFFYKLPVKIFWESCVFRSCGICAGSQEARNLFKSLLFEPVKKCQPKKYQPTIHSLKKCLDVSPTLLIRRSYLRDPGNYIN